MATIAPIERRARVLHGDCLTVLAGLDAESIDAVITDPPYDLGFMGKAWDRAGVAFQVATWAAVARVLKPGGHLLAFGGTRTSHRMVCAIEDAGFEVRDCLMWLYGSGFPKSLDVSKAIDKAAGALGTQSRRFSNAGRGEMGLPSPSRQFQAAEGYQYDPATDAARRWQGWGTALKPAYEPIVLARKPLVGTVAQNVQTYGTGAINVDGCRVNTATADDYGRSTTRADGTLSISRSDGYGLSHTPSQPSSLGRWPANVIHDGSAEVVGLFPQARSAGVYGNEKNVSKGQLFGVRTGGSTYDDTGSAARFFYTAKASRRERGEGNTHPTVKPLALMRYLCKLITPPDGLILDPFAGSGSTGVAAVREGFRFLGIEQDDASVGTAKRRTVETEFLPLERFLLDEGDE